MSIDIDKAISLVKQEVAGFQVPVVDLIAVQTADPFKVLVATILSARTKDEVTAKASARLFEHAQTPEELAMLSVSQLEKLIYPVGFYKNKAKYLNALPQVLQDSFDGAVPQTMEALLKLPGVGRKTANLVLAVAFQIPAICVDTHVHRIMNIWGYVETETPLQTEMALRKQLPQKYWLDINSILVAYGQGLCKPQRPHCDVCILEKDCPQIGVTPRKRKTDSLGSKDSLRFVSWNVNGLRAVLKKEFLEIFQSFDADIFAVQEIKAMPEQLPDSVLTLSGYHIYWNPAEKKGYSGTAVFSKIEPQNVLYGIGIEEFDKEGRVLTAEYDDFFFINSYFPNAQPGLKRLDFKIRFDQALQAFIQQLNQQKPVVLCGDLNVAHKPIDLANPKSNEKNPGFSAEERAWMDVMIDEGYIDTFRAFNQEPDQYTWWSYRFNARAKNIGWRIDYFLVDEKSRKRLVSADIHADIVGSDHCPVSIEYQI
ncbi:MAG: exodeoxyribonuclease III [Desulfobulbus propionicus]|nr:MAG: exodeoxyribonuclease III [Desulfobulbus propionicus]